MLHAFFAPVTVSCLITQRRLHLSAASWEETPRGLLALIVILDQFSRHTYRDVVLEEDDEPEIDAKASNSEQFPRRSSSSSGAEQRLAKRETALRENDEHAHRLSKLLLAKGWEEMLSTQERIFAIMPFRHSPTLKSLELVLFKV